VALNEIIRHIAHPYKDWIADQRGGLWIWPRRPEKKRGLRDEGDTTQRSCRWGAWQGATLLYEQLGAYAQEGAPLKLERCVALPGYTGDFNHYAVDTVRGRCS
jgi:hypothetical protein